MPEAIPIESTGEAKTLQSPESLWMAKPEFQLKHRRKRVNVLQTISAERISELTQRLEGIWAAFEPTVSSELIITEAPSAEASMGATKLKHTIQNGAIIQHLQRAEMWDKKHMYIEWGAGNANLSLDIQNQLQSDHIIVDRKTPKAKSDSKRDRELIWRRLTIDIKDLDLRLVPELSRAQSSSPPASNGTQHDSLCSFSKHLCGAATDLTIRCLEQYQSRGGSDSLLIALCCHHRCTWQTFVGKAFFMDTLGLGKEDFEIMARMSSWATSEEHDKDGAKAENEGALATSISGEDRATWGWRCKRIIDLGRVHHLKTLGFETVFKYYVPEAVSLENILMICRRPPPPKPAESSGHM